MSLQLHAIMLNYADTAWYCVILRAVAAKFTQHHALDLCVGEVRARAWLQSISVNAVIEINMFDYNVHARARAQCE